MDKKSKKYIQKRRKIIAIIEQIEVVYENDEIRVSTNPDFWQSRDAAEKILSSVGINKPKELSENETAGVSYN